LTQSLATGWISARAEQAFELDGVDWRDLQGIRLEAFGLRPSPCGNRDIWVYQSRPYRLLGYELQPELRCNVQRSYQSLDLRINDVVLNGQSGMAGWFRVNSTIRLTPAPMGTLSQQWLELSFSRRGPLALLPRAGVGLLLERAVAESNARIGRALKRRLQKACAVAFEGRTPCPI